MQVLEHLERPIVFPATPMKYDWTQLPTPAKKGELDLDHEVSKNNVSKDPDALFGSSPSDASSDDFRYADALPFPLQ